MKQRIITGAVLAILALIWLFMMPSPAFQLVVLGITFIGMYEWLNIHALHDELHLRAYLGLIACLSILLTFPSLIFIACCIVIGIYFDGLRRIHLFEQHKLDVKTRRHCMTALIKGVITLSTFACILIDWQSKSVVHHLSGVWLILLIALIIIASDVGAYFTGKFLGKHKLCPQTSPNKTWEGLIGGLLCSVLVAFFFIKVFSWYCPFSTVVPALLIALASVVGDLRISLSKRIYGVKDTGSIFPGHGGVLDRLDGWLAGFPVAYLLF